MDVCARREEGAVQESWSWFEDAHLRSVMSAPCQCNSVCGGPTFSRGVLLRHLHLTGSGQQRPDQVELVDARPGAVAADPPKPLLQVPLGTATKPRWGATSARQAGRQEVGGVTPTRTY